MEKWTKEEWQEKVIQSVDENHIWLNAFSCIRPTDKFCADLGRQIISMLNNKENLLPSDGITSDNETIRDLSMMTMQLYVRINKS